jgi:hypothetical protein
MVRIFSLALEPTGTKTVTADITISAWSLALRFVLLMLPRAFLSTLLELGTPRDFYWLDPNSGSICPPCTGSEQLNKHCQ